MQTPNRAHGTEQPPALDKYQYEVRVEPSKIVNLGEHLSRIRGWLRRKSVSSDLQQLELKESVNFELETIFVAVPKTGTTSVRVQFASKGPFLIPACHLNIVEIRDSLFLYFLRRATGTNDTFPNESVLSTSDIKNEAQAVFDRFFKFSSVRNPWARAVSLYFHRKRGRVVDKMDFETFCMRHILASDNCVWPTRHSNQIDWITDGHNNILVDYVYRLEDLEKAVDEIRDLTGNRIKLEPSVRNRNPRSRSLDYREVFNDRSRKAIAKAFEKDIDHFKYTF